MKQTHDERSIQTQGTGLTEITDMASDFVGQGGFSEGLLTLFCRHTSASLLVQENADPDVMRDLQDFFAALVKEDARLYRHSTEGTDDMPAHIRAALTQTSLSIPVLDGRMVLGTWQGIYLFEHRTRPHLRKITLHLIGA